MELKSGSVVVTVIVVVVHRADDRQVRKRGNSSDRCLGAESGLEALLLWW